MIICPRCEIEYDQGEKVCGTCGSPLVFREDPQPEDKASDGKKKELKICPKCKMLFEKADRCLRCGAPLVAQDPSQETGGSKPHPKPEKRESPHARGSGRQPESQKRTLICPSCKIPYDVGTSCKICGLRLVPHVPQERNGKSSAAEATEFGKSELGQDIQQSLKESSENTRRMIPPPAGRRRTLSLGTFAAAVIVVLVVAAGYFLMQKTLQSHRASSTVIVPIEPSLEEQEAERIKGLLENIRQANLREDIELFMSCYSPDFKGREEKKRSTLETWRSSDFLDLSYDLKNQSVSGNTANIKVEWLSKISQRINGQLQEGRIVVEALLKKESESWKIKEIRPVN